ncbi:uncharacterized protein LOC125588497 [Brassica napus]|uniref:uncharacterized protein LOC125588497 n=1 Tax=Brassica napus TaxID=3708 RepID=UPI00207A1288|nr:uncharacterized protein LOC125588497 [Brassica napus]
MATSWLDHDQYFGASWLVCDSQGLPIFHSRRAFAPIRSSLEASLTSLMWVVEALQDLRVGKVVVELSSAMVWKAISSPHNFPHLAFEISIIIRSSYQFDQCHIEMVYEDTNNIAVEIATSVTKDRRYKSYIANGGSR